MSRGSVHQGSMIRRSVWCALRMGAARWLSALGMCGLLVAMSLLASATHLAHAAQPGQDEPLPAPAALSEALQQAATKKQPLVMMVSLAGCPYCREVRSHYLRPLQREGLPVYQINMQDASPIRDFDGTVTTQAALIKKWGVKVAPTVLFFGRNGVEVADRLTGALLPDFYNAYLETQLQTARGKLSP